MSFNAASSEEAAYAARVARGAVAATLCTPTLALVRRLPSIRLMLAYRDCASDWLCIQFGVILSLIWGLERLLT